MAVIPVANPLRYPRLPSTLEVPWAMQNMRTRGNTDSVNSYSVTNNSNNIVNVYEVIAGGTSEMT